MRSSVIPSEDVTQETLRARDYVYSPSHEADKIVDEWLEANPGFMHKSTPAMKDLRSRLIAGLTSAVIAGVKGSKVG